MMRRTMTRNKGHRNMPGNNDVNENNHKKVVAMTTLILLVCDIIPNRKKTTKPHASYSNNTRIPI